jgi:hypothetical protein
VARWERTDGSELDALFSTRYEWDGDGQFEHPQFRKLEADPSFDGTTFKSRYQGFIKHLPAAEDEEARKSGAELSGRGYLAKPLTDSPLHRNGRRTPRS